MADKSEYKKTRLKEVLLEELAYRTKKYPLTLTTFSYGYNANNAHDFLFEDIEEEIAVLRDCGHLIINIGCRYWIASTYEEWTEYRDRELTPVASRLLGRLQAMSESAAKLKHLAAQTSTADNLSVVACGSVPFFSLIDQEAAARDFGEAAAKYTREKDKHGHT